MSPLSPLISVVIPTYNHAHFIGRAIQSVLDQTYSNWEVVIVDNHSQDNTHEVVSGFNDPRIKLLSIHNHGVIAASRNLAIQQATGEFIAFLDSDDLWYPQKLALCLEKINQGYDLVCHAERWVGEGCDRKVVYGPESRASYESLLFEGNCISSSASVVKAALLKDVGGFSEDPQLITAEDYELWLNLAYHGARIGFIDELLGEYTLHPGNQSRSVLRNMQAVAWAVNMHQNRFEKWGLRETLKARRRKAIILYSGARGLQDTGAFKEAWNYFFQSLSAWPFLPKTYLAMGLNLFKYGIGRR